MEDTAKNIVIFTTFSEVSEAYSLNRVVQDQIKMLTRNGYSPTVIVQEGFVPSQMYAHPAVTIKTIPLVPCHNEIKKDPSFDQDVDSIYNKLKEIINDNSVVLTHDVVYQPAALKHNFASRRLAREVQAKWLHWIHSATSPVTLGALQTHFQDGYLDLVRSPFNNSKYIFFNDYSKPRIARNFGVSEELVKTVHHPTDVGGFLGLSKEVQELIDDRNLFSADAVLTYPARLDRGKQVQHAVKTMAKLKDFDLSVRVIVADFHSTGGDKVTYRQELKQIGIENGLNSNELIFLSEVRPEWNVEVSHEVIRDLQLISNVFIMPSVSESYSLVTQEAGLTKQVVVLNQDFAPFRDIFGPDAIYRQYSANIGFNGYDGDINTAYGNEDVYHKETAGIIASRLNHPEMAFATKIRKTRNLDYVFKHELEPLFFD